MKKLLILSGKGGTGKTTTAAAFISFMNARAFADCDVDAPNLHLISHIPSIAQKSNFYGSPKASIDQAKCVGCGLCSQSCRFDSISKTPNGLFTVNEFACEGCGVCHLVCKYGAVTMLDDVAGILSLQKNGAVFSTATLRMGRGNSGKLVAKVKSEMTNATPPDVEFAIIDGSPGIGCPVIASISGVDLILIVAEPSISGFSDMERIVKTAQIFETKTIICVNKYDVSLINTEKIKLFCQTNNIPFVRVVPYDKTVSETINAGKSIAEVVCPASIALKEIYKRTISLLGDTTK